MTAIPEVDAFVRQLRAHYRACGLADADEQADDYAARIAGMYRATIGYPPSAEHFARVLEVHRREDLSFEEKREQLAVLFANTGAARH